MSNMAIEVLTEQLAKVREQAPAACGLEDCYDLPTAVRVLIDFAWRAVNGSGVNCSSAGSEKNCQCCGRSLEMFTADLDWCPNCHKTYDGC